MYFLHLEAILRTRKYKDEALQALDNYLAFLTPGKRDRITADDIYHRLHIRIETAVVLLEECCNVGLLEKRYALECPKCTHLFKIVSEHEIYNELSTEHFCEECGTDAFFITMNSVMILYKLNERPIIKKK